MQIHDHSQNSARDTAVNEFDKKSFQTRKSTLTKAPLLNPGSSIRQVSKFGTQGLGFRV